MIFWPSHGAAVAGWGSPVSAILVARVSVRSWLPRVHEVAMSQRASTMRGRGLQNDVSASVGGLLCGNSVSYRMAIRANDKRP